MSGKLCERSYGGCEDKAPQRGASTLTAGRFTHLILLEVLFELCVVIRSSVFFCGTRFSHACSRKRAAHGRLLYCLLLRRLRKSLGGFHWREDYSSVGRIVNWWRGSLTRVTRL